MTTIPISEAIEDAIICQSQNTPSINEQKPGEWYVYTKGNDSNGRGVKIYTNDEDLGWSRNVSSNDSHVQVILNRISNTSLEGKFTCEISGDRNNQGYLYIFYPSKYHRKNGIVTNVIMKYAFSKKLS